VDRLGNRRSGGDSALRPPPEAPLAPRDARPPRRLRAPRSLRATRAGWCFVAIIFGVGFAALNTGNNLLYLVFALMLAFLVLSGILSETSLRGIAVERILPREIFAGTANPVVLRIRNRQKRVAAFALSVEDRLDMGSALAPAGRVFVLRVGPGASVDRSHAWSPARRGPHAFAGLRVSTRFPFGLFVKSLDLDLPAEGLAYPTLQPVSTPLAPRPAHDASLDRAGRSPDGDALAGVREYVRGDSTARVHWRRSVRSGRLVVGEREGQASAEVEILLPLPPGLAPTAVEERVSRAATDVVAQLAAGHRVGLRTATARFAPATGAAQRRELLRFLARVTPDAPAAGAPNAVTAAPDVEVPA